MAIYPFELPTDAQVSAVVNAWKAGNPTFAAALETEMAVAEALGRLGFRLFRDDRTVESVQVFLAAVAIDPDNRSCWMNLAVAFDRIGLLREAAGCLVHTLANAKSQPAAWLLLGTVRTKLQDLEGAEAAYVEATRLEGESFLAWHCLGLVRQERGNLVGAIDCFCACAARGGKTGGVLGNLGKLYCQVGRFAESVEAYTIALELDQRNSSYLQGLRRAIFLRDLRNWPVEDALTTYQNSRPTNAPEADCELNDVLQDAVSMLSGFGHHDAAVRVARTWLELIPGSAAADYLVKAMIGGPGMERSPAEYIVEYFDRFSEGFDEKLVKVLHYDLPANLCLALASVAEAGRQFDTLEIGCGTGLCGPLLKPISRELIGVDLSPKMLEQAWRRGAYDMLYCEELLTFLQRSAGRFDLVVAADVLIYFGDLRPVWAGARNALKAGGLLVFSTESAAREGYRLQASGRFAHSKEYIRSTTAAYFDERHWTETTLRKEATKPVLGNLFVLGRR